MAPPFAEKGTVSAHLFLVKHTQTAFIARSRLPAPEGSRVGMNVHEEHVNTMGLREWVLRLIRILRSRPLRGGGNLKDRPSCQRCIRSCGV